MIAVDANILVYASRAEAPAHGRALGALRSIDRLLASPSARLLLPGPAFHGLFSALCRAADARGNLAYDAAICREWSVPEILSEDRDFARFPHLRVRRLLDAPPES